MYQSVNTTKEMKGVQTPSVPPEIQELIQRYPTVFSDDRSQAIKSCKAKINIKENPNFWVHKGYELPYSIKAQVTDQIRVEVQEGRWIHVDQAEAGIASPLWPVPKPDKTLRLCGDYKRILNPNVVTDNCILEKPEEMYNAMQGCNYFCVIDLSEAYLQMELEEESQKYLMLNTHLGFFKPTRLMYGVSSAPGIFQRFMDNVVKGFENVKCYLDDVILGAKDKRMLLAKLDKLLQKFASLNIRVNLAKCKWLKEEVECLGHIVGKDGLRVSSKRVQPILDARKPNSVSETRAYLGAVNFYRRFLPNVSDLLKPLTELTKERTPFVWTEQCEQAFLESKILLAKNRMLTLYDPTKPLVLVCDASPYGVGCLIAHRIDGIEYPISYASSKLSPAQSNYSQIEREALGNYIWRNVLP